MPLSIRIGIKGESRGVPGIVVAQISRNMRGSLGETIILATCFAACVAVCRPGLNGRNDWYRCEGLTEINVRDVISDFSILQKIERIFKFSSISIHSFKEF